MTPTPGPWTVGEHRGVWVGPVVKAGRTGVAFIVGEHDANARLIAAAPDLLHALRLIAEDLNAMDSDTNGWREWDATSVDQVIAGALRRADLVIAKAEGRGE